MTTYRFLTTSGEFGALEVSDDEARVFLSRRGKTERIARADASRHAPAPPPGTDPNLWPYLHHLWLRDSKVNESSLVSSATPGGAYFPRVWRGIHRPHNPLYSYRPYHPNDVGDARAYSQSLVAARSLYDNFDILSRSIEPAFSNLTAYGHRCRELLLLACMEIEAAWRGILRENGKTDPQNRPTTQDYVSLLAPIKLNQWCVRLRDYKELGDFRPFEKWDAAEPTRSLVWYDAYNKTKHDREHHFSNATFGHGITALAALHVMISAQWGPETFSFLFDRVESPFELTSLPQWSPDELYLPPALNGSTEWTKRALFQDAQPRHLSDPGHANNLRQLRQLPNSWSGRG